MTKYFSAKLGRATKRIKNANEALKNAHKSKSGIEAAKREFEEASEKLGILLEKDVKAKHEIHGGARRRRATKHRRRSRVTRKQK
jgi:carbamoylphosphate synthase large subunit